MKLVNKRKPGWFSAGRSMLRAVTALPVIMLLALTGGCPLVSMDTMPESVHLLDDEIIVTVTNGKNAMTAVFLAECASKDKAPCEIGDTEYPSNVRKSEITQSLQIEKDGHVWQLVGGAEFSDASTHQLDSKVSKLDSKVLSKSGDYGHKVSLSVFSTETIERIKQGELVVLVFLEDNTTYEIYFVDESIIYYSE